MGTRIERAEFKDNEYHMEVSKYLLPRDRVWYESWLNKVYHYVMIECSSDEGHATISTTPGNNAIVSPNRPEFLGVKNPDLIKHLTDVKMGDTHTLNIKPSLDEPSQIYHITQE